VAEEYWTLRARRRLTRRGLLRGASVGAAGLAGAVLFGCGGREGTSSKTSSSSGSAPAVVSGKPGGRIARAQASDPPTFDQHGQSSTVVNLPASPMFNTLVQFDPMDGDEKASSIIPDLATSWEVSPDGQTYTFKMKQGVKFHDGTPFVSADVKASLERQITPPKGLAPPRQDQLKVIKSIETPDDATLRLTMQRPVSPLSMLPILGQGWMAIYAQRDAMDEKYDWKTKANGTGPFYNLKYERGSKISMEKFPGYHVKDRPYLDGLDVFVIPNAATRDEYLGAGQLQIGALPAASADSLKKQIGDKAVFFKRSSLGFTVMNFNTSKSPWNDERVRRAVALGINKEDAIKVIVKGEGVIGGYLLPGGDWALGKEEVQKLAGYEPQGPNSISEAKKLLSAAGVQEGLNVTLLVRQNFYEDTALFTADQLTQFGWKIKQDSQETATAYDRINKRDFDLVPWGHGVSLDDPDALWAEFYIKGAPRNYSELSTPEIEAAYLKQSVELDPVRRKALVKDLEKVSLPALGKIMYYWSIGQSAVYKQVQGYITHVSSYNNQKMESVWLNS
jgi:peptide/nickel transport system substrate-binding protein